MSHRLRKCIPVLLLGIVPVAFGQGRPSDAQIERLMSKSGATRETEQLFRQARGMSDKAGEREAQAFGVSLADFRAIFERTLNPAAISKEVARQLQQELNDGEVQQLLAYFESPAGQKIVDRVSGVPIDPAQLRQQVPQLVKDQSRVAFARQAASVMAGGDAVADSLINAQLLIPTVVAAIEPGAGAFVAAMREGVELQRQQLRDSALTAVTLTLLYNLRDVESAELASFASVASSPIMRKYYEVSRRAGNSVGRDAIAALAAALAAARRPAAGEAVGVTVEKKGNVTNINLASMTGTIQQQLLSAIRSLPPAQDAAVLAWGQRHQRVLPPSFLYELARRNWSRNHDEAFEWFALAQIRSRYDALRCTDSSPVQGTTLLPGVAQNVATGIEGERAAYGKAGLRALAREDAFEADVSPWWICSHGMAAINAAIQGKKAESWLIPEERWEPLRADLRRDFRSYFEEQGKPQDDPIPASTRAFPSRTAPLANVDGLAWLDENRLVLSVNAKGPDGKPARSLHVFHRDGTLTEARNAPGLASRTAWCAGKGNLYRQSSFPRKQEDGRMKLEFVQGPPDRPESASLVVNGGFLYARQVNDGSQHWTRPWNGWRQSPFDCRWVESETLAGPGGLSTLVPLLPNHGFLRFGEGAPVPAEAPLQYFAAESAAPVPLPPRASEVTEGSIGYYAFKGAYFIPRTVTRGQRAEPACAWWLTPGSGKTEEVCLPRDALVGQFFTLAPSRAGILRNLRQRQTAHGSKPGGVYLSTPDGKVERILEASASTWAVSPDGCAVAIEEKAQVRVLELCR
ncbi:MAG TPA: DUF2059 domain-containing protein [Burkholderiales bacterium]|nr:DUF2059 domain-containing protein [Burkholderiales bacterium]